ncbi:MAG: glycoside hydrolase family 38 C-terminal domain-containing protein [Terrimicrobiaceae bacterium]
MKSRVLHLVSQAHLDPVWLWPVRDGIAEALTTMRSAVDRAAETRSFKFTRSSAITYRWVKEMDPHLYAEIGKLIKAGRWEVIGGWLEQPDCNLPATESFFRQGLHAQTFFKKEFGSDGKTRIGYNVDSFGHAGGLPQILKKSGLDYYVFLRPMPGDNPALPLLFWWESPDGSRVLTQRIGLQYSQSYSATIADIDATIRAACAQCFAPGMDHGVTWFGVGNHGGGPTREHIAHILEMQKDPTLPDIRFSTVRDYFSAVERSSNFKSLPVVRGELGFCLRGCYAATGEVKALHRQSEKALQAAEQFAVLAAGSETQKPPDRLRDAWSHLLFNEFHDILAGTCVSGTQDETRHRFGATLTPANEAATRAAYTMARRVDTRSEKGSVLFAANSLPWPRTALVEIDTFISPHGREKITHLETRDGKRIPLQWATADANFGPWGLRWGKLTAALPLPAGGYRSFRVCTEPLDLPPEDPFATGTVATDQFVKNGKEIVPPGPFTKNPALASLKSPAGRELLAAPLGVVVIEDKSDTWGYHVRQFRKELGQPEIVRTQEIESGPVISVTRQISRWESSEIWMDVIRITGSPVVGLRFRINWQEKRQIAKLDIPTKLKKCELLAKMPGEIARRPANGDEFPNHDWIALAGNLGKKSATLGVINDSTYTHDAKQGIVRQCLVRSVAFAEHPPFNYTDDTYVRFADQGWQERRFWLLASDGPVDTASLDRLSQECQIPAQAMMDSGHPGTEPWEASRFALEPADVSLLAFKHAEAGGGVILRVQEMSGKAVQARGVWQNRRFSFRLKPWEIKTLQLVRSKSRLIAKTIRALEN